MAPTRALLLLLTSAYLLFSLYKLSPLSDHHSHDHDQSFQDFIESLNIFKSNRIKPTPSIAESADHIVVEVLEDDKQEGWPVIDVVVLTENNFSEFVHKNRYVMVMFYAPWCYWSQKLAPDFEAAAQLLKGTNKAEAVLAMADASLETSLGRKYHIQAYPTMYLFVDGVKKYLYDSNNERTRDAIVTWVKTKMAIAEFVSTRKLPLVINFTNEGATSIFHNPLKQLWLFAAKSDPKVICTFEEAAEAFRGKLLFVHVDLDDESFGKQLAYKFGATEDAPTVVAYNSLDLKKTLFNGELTLNNIKCFAEDFLKDELLRKSDPASETILKLPSQSHHASHQLNLLM